MVSDNSRSRRYSFCCLAIALSLAAANVGQAFQPDRARRSTSNDPKKRPFAERKATKKPKFELRDGDRVVFLGNTLIEREQKYGYWETMLTARYPDRKIIFRNLGWDGDTVWAESRGLFDPPEKGYARMLAHVGRIKPTVLFLGYGNNEAFAGQPGLPRFVKQYNKLLDDLTRVSAKGVRFVVISPLRQESIASRNSRANPAEYNRKLEGYVKAIDSIASERKAEYIDLIKHQTEERDGLTVDGLHLGQKGYEATTGAIWSMLPEADDPGLAGWYLFSLLIKMKSDWKLTEVTGAKVDQMKIIRDGVRLRLRTNTILPRQPHFLIPDLPAGSYAIRIDGKPTRLHWYRFLFNPNGSGSGHSAVAADFGMGVNVENPDARRFETLRQAIIAKNRLYFHSWRPQNVTYLFLFRKHEQGQNAKEMREFERLVAAKEKEIDRLKKPVTRTYELIRVKPKKK